MSKHKKQQKDIKITQITERCQKYNKSTGKMSKTQQINGQTRV